MTFLFFFFFFFKKKKRKIEKFLKKRKKRKNLVRIAREGYSEILSKEGNPIILQNAWQTIGAIKCPLFFFFPSD